MDLPQIETCLSSRDVQSRLRAITALRAYETAIAVPLLCGCLNDPEFLVRSMVALALGYKRNVESFDALSGLMRDDDDPNVRAEAAAALGRFGQRAIAPLLASFAGDPNWLVRQSILAAFTELEAPIELFKICSQALQDPDLSVQEAGISALGRFAGTDLQTTALDKLVPATKAEHWQIRAAAARALHPFDHYDARNALKSLQGDEDHRVVAAVLERLVRPS